jgi:hypothetical protein
MSAIDHRAAITVLLSIRVVAPTQEKATTEQALMIVQAMNQHLRASRSMALLTPENTKNILKMTFPRDQKLSTQKCNRARASHKKFVSD